MICKSQYSERQRKVSILLETFDADSEKSPAPGIHRDGPMHLSWVYQHRSADSPVTLAKHILSGKAPLYARRSYWPSNDFVAEFALMAHGVRTPVRLGLHSRTRNSQSNRSPHCIDLQTRLVEWTGHITREGPLSPPDFNSQVQQPIAWARTAPHELIGAESLVQSWRDLEGGNLRDTAHAVGNASSSWPILALRPSANICMACRVQDSKSRKGLKPCPQERGQAPFSILLAKHFDLV